MDSAGAVFWQETFAALANLPSRAGTNMQAQVKAQFRLRQAFSWELYLSTLRGGSMRDRKPPKRR